MIQDVFLIALCTLVQLVVVFVVVVVVCSFFGGGHSVDNMR